MRRSLAILSIFGFCLRAQAQNSSDLINSLRGAGLTSLASALQLANETQEGQNLLSQLMNGNHTLFAPDNQAFDDPIVQPLANDPAGLANVLAYHVLPGNFVNSSMNSSALASGVLPNVTLGHTLLANSSLVQLEGNKSQVLAWSRNDSDGQIYFLNQNPQVNVLNTSTIGNNLLVASIDGVLQLPGNISSVLDQNNLTSVLGFLNMVNVPGFYSNGSNATVNGVLDANTTRGYTFFAPNNEAILNANSSLASLANNQTALAILLQNHYINGSSYYSPQLYSVASNGSNSNLNSSDLISAAGEPFSLNTNSSGTFVTSGNGASAKIVKSDLLTENGVIHIIDHVLANTDSHPGRASSAYASATSVAAQSSTQTGPIEGLPTSSATGTSRSNNPSNDAASIRVGSMWGLIIAGAFGWAMVMFVGV
ncbi:hypothetical protein H2248_004106 [Termitomyces sp. 'cryptogamus']|nr:hypothetical protein H2248_004106 [Termitomyces sp. 'cryptogamus']